jgi:hypothetical protein
MLSAEQGLLAVYEFLDSLWERTGRPEELGFFCGMISYTPGVGSRDRAMWYDWLARVKKLQTGELVPENSGERGRLTAQMMKPLEPEQAYLAMYDFIEEYWLRVNRPAELGDLLARLRYTPGRGAADPALWERWLEAVGKVHRDTPGSS